MTKNVKRKAPCRVRYEQGHPTISCRVPKEIYERLQHIKKREGRSFADVLKVGLGMLELKAEKEDQDYAEGFEDGYSEAETEFKVTYPCSVCKETIVVKTEYQKEVIKHYMWNTHGVTKNVTNGESEKQQG